jgi:pSer/pThr/pTyr-binding forkhead associated (FHA) protein
MPELVVKLGDSVVQRYVIDKDLISIGRAKDNDIVIDNLSVSRNHARIRRQGNSYVLTDLNSSNGTFVNKVRITKTEILDGDVIAIGKHQIEFINKDLSESDVIVSALAADRTMMIDRHDTIGELLFTDGKLKGKVVVLTKSETSIGKSPYNDIVIADDWFLAKKQAVIRHEGDEYEIRDLGTLRRTRVNGQPVSGAHKLADGDVIEVGSERCVFRLKPREEVEAPSGRVPKELGLDDSVFASVSDVGPALHPSGAGSSNDRPSPIEADEDWSDAAAQRVEQAEAPPTPPAPEGIELRDIELEMPSRTFAREEVEEAARAASNAKAEEIAEAGPEAKSEDTGGTASRSSGRLSRRKQRQHRHQDKSAEAETVAAAAVKEQLREAAASAQAPEPAGEAKAGAPEAHATEPTMSVHQESRAALSAAQQATQPGLSVDEQVAVWEAALKNPSPVIRRQAAKMLKKLTGKDYAY